MRDNNQVGASFLDARYSLHSVDGEWRRMSHASCREAYVKRRERPVDCVSCLTDRSSANGLLGETQSFSR